VNPIMVVEDHPDVRTLLCDVLSENGYTVVPCTDGADALAKLLRCEPKPGLILLDLSMPVMDGFEFRRRQLAEPTVRDVPVVLVSADHGLEQRTRELAAAGWVQKPVRIRDLLALAARYIGAPARR
jgi:CheY-like chemotaxis protein